jgi:hypothetical protein
MRVSHCVVTNAIAGGQLGGDQLRVEPHVAPFNTEGCFSVMAGEGIENKLGVRQ